MKKQRKYENNKENRNEMDRKVECKDAVMPGQIGYKDSKTTEEIIKKLECVD